MILSLRQLNPEEILSIADMFSEIDFVKITSLECLGKCLTGEYTVVGAIKDDEIVGFAAYVVNGNYAVVVATCLIHNLKQFRDDFFAGLKAQGIEVVLAESNREENAYQRIMGLKKIYSVYERRL